MLKKMNDVTTTVVARINNQEIVVLIENDEKRVAIRPLCDALGINYASQFTKLKNDELLGPVVVLSTTTGADGKQYEMVTIPFRYVFGWLFTINAKNVAPEAKETVLNYQMACYDVLFDYFNGYAEFVEFKQKLIAENQRVLDLAKKNFTSARDIKSKAESEMSRVIHLTYDEYKMDQAQLTMFSEDEQKGVANE